MANAIKRISVARGYDVSGYVLQCFGGAGGQHACAVADALGMTRIYAHPMAGVLSAYGMGLADQIAMREGSVELPLDEGGLQAAEQRLEALTRHAVDEVTGQGVAPAAVRTRAQAHIRYQGTDMALTVPVPRRVPPHEAIEAMRQDFEAAYRQRFSFLMPDKELVIEAVSVEAIGPGEAAEVPPETAQAPSCVASPIESVRMYCVDDAAPAAGARRACTAARRSSRRLDRRPRDRGGSQRDHGGRARLASAAAAGGALELRRVRARGATHAIGTAADPVMLEVFNNLFMNIAEQMGLRLQNTAHSVNIKERLDFSCALFDVEGQLIANAPHIPVHLGSMSDSIKTVIARNPHMQAGDVYVLNDPYHGGTHLPDVSVITPVFLDSNDARPSFYVASRGHHSDIGGLTPGSMPPFSTRIEDEGVLIDNFKLVEAGRLREAEFIALLGSGRYPSRNPLQNLADLRAQIAANEKGAAGTARDGRAVRPATGGGLHAHVQDNAEEAVRRVITALKDGEFSLPLDNGACIEVSVRVDRERRSACIDFSGTSAQLPNNFNGPKSITMAAVLYVFRTLVDDDIPLNAGCMKPLHVIVPEGCMLNPLPPARWWRATWRHRAASPMRCTARLGCWRRANAR
jgi:5-oxoprolinase (ATP-hydrolysing)